MSINRDRSESQAPNWWKIINPWETRPILPYHYFGVFWADFRDWHRQYNKEDSVCVTFYPSSTISRLVASIVGTRRSKVHSVYHYLIDHGSKHILIQPYTSILKEARLDIEQSKEDPDWLDTIYSSLKSKLSLGVLSPEAKQNVYVSEEVKKRLSHLSYIFGVTETDLIHLCCHIVLREVDERLIALVEKAEMRLRQRAFSAKGWAAGLKENKTYEGNEEYEDIGQ